MLEPMANIVNRYRSATRPILGSDRDWNHDAQRDGRNSECRDGLDLTSNAWPHDSLARNHFNCCDRDAQLEILAFLTLFVHEYTHRIDFLISPFGLQFYANTLREYWMMQQFMPRILDDARTVDRLRFLAGFGENPADDPLKTTGADRVWKDLEELVRVFYAWGDVAGVTPLRKYVQDGWSDQIRGAGDAFGVDVVVEPVTVLNFFYTFRVPGTSSSFWYLRPLTIFETKAVVNSLLFIQHLLGDESRELCLDYYRAVYLRRRDQLPSDYFFLLDMGARIYGLPDFETLLRDGRYARSALLILSSICWYALQAPPPLRGQDGRFANPILRLWVAFRALTRYARAQLKSDFGSTAELLLWLDQSPSARNFFVLPIGQVLDNCRQVVDFMLKENSERTWHPDVQDHFEHIFSLMRPHFQGRESTYTSYLGMPESGNPLSGCHSPEDWELTYDDYTTPEATKKWFALRTDVLFSYLKPSTKVIEELDEHFQAFLVPYHCECGQGFTPQWHSRFPKRYVLTCGFCGRKKTLNREDFTIIGISPDVDAS
jgi:hypothetical protein